MNNDLDEVWFGKRDVFNVEDSQNHSWRATTDSIEFPRRKKGHGWHAYVEAPRLEITCGEAPFVCSRYDTVTGDELPVSERVGFLDRKLRVVSEKTKTRKEWVRRALDALRATYGFEYQGDNLLIARINVIETFVEHLRDRWGSGATQEELEQAAWIVSWNLWQMNGFTDAVARINVIETFVEHLRDRWGSGATQEELEQAAWIVSWNLWQMNGFTDAVPTNKTGAEVESTLGTFEEPEPEPVQQSLFDLFDNVFPDEKAEEGEKASSETVPLCVIYDWKNGRPFEFAALKRQVVDTMTHSTAQHSTQHSTAQHKFYAVIGNPPYQEQTDSESTRMPPIYHEFMEQSYRVSDKVELITPARFLFNAGYTPKAWNRKMLDDPHLKVLDYKQKSDEVFPNTDIKGGVAVTLRDANADFGPISIFTAHNELNSIVKKTLAVSTLFLNDIVYPALSYKATALMTEEHRELLPRMKSKADPDPKSLRLRTNAFENLHELFFEQEPNDGRTYIELLV